MTVSPNKLMLKRNKSGKVTVAVTGEDDCLVEGEAITATISNACQKRISISQASEVTDENGQAEFTINALKKTGNAIVSFTSGSLKKVLIVKIRK